MYSLDDFSLLDRPEILSFLFYPRRDYRPGPPNSTDYNIRVDNGVEIACRFYTHSRNSPTIIYFHGNGEVVCDHDYIAPYYNELGINLFVADYRGYGASGGTPSFRSIVGDAHILLAAMRSILEKESYGEKLFIMGRSLGSISAVELASHYPNQFNGIILESGFASFNRLMIGVGYKQASDGLPDNDFPNLGSIRNITLPTLILHGENDNLIPATEAKVMFEHSAAKQKQLVIIAGAGHNDIILLGMEEYFSAIHDFVYCPSV